MLKYGNYFNITWEYFVKTSSDEVALYNGGHEMSAPPGRDYV